MSRARDLADLLDSTGDVKSAALDNATTSLSDLGITKSSSEINALSSFDDNKILNDISTLALRQASDNNKIAYNTNSSFVDVFQDASGVATFTNTERTSLEKIRNTVNAGSQTYFDPPIKKIQTNTSFSTGSWSGAQSNGMMVRTSGYAMGGIDYGFPTDVDWECRIYMVSTSSGAWTATNYPGLSTLITTNTDYQGSSPSGLWNSAQSYSEYGALRKEYWGYHLSSAANTAIGTSSLTDHWTQGTTTSSYDASNSSFTCAHYLNNNVQYNGMKITYSSTTNTLVAGFFNGTDGGITSYGRMTVSNVPGEGTVFIVFGEANSYNQGWATNYSGSTNNSYITTASSLASATGSIIGDTITPSSSVSSMGAVITYENTVGTNTLNTDIVLELSADGGTNWTTATLTALPDFSTGIKMAKANDVSVTAGTSLKYRISTANQSYGTKQVEIVGVALQF